MRPRWPRCKLKCVSGCCALASATVCSISAMVTKWAAGRTAGVSRSTPRCASRAPTWPGGNNCCAIAPARRSPDKMLDARVHRHCYYGVLAPNAPWRAAVTALAPMPAPAAGTPADAPHRAAARYLWAMLLARIYEVLVRPQSRLAAAAWCAEPEGGILVPNQAKLVAKLVVDTGEAPADTSNGAVKIAIRRHCDSGDEHESDLWRRHRRTSSVS